MESPFEIKPYLEEARSRTTEQFKGKPVFDRYLQLLLSESTRLQEEYRKLKQDRSIDTAVGAQLDIIGEIVGRPRGFLTADLFKFFGFEGDPQSGSMGSESSTQTGSPFWSEGSPLSRSRPPTDEEYRLLIKAKIIKNTTTSSTEDTISAFRFLFATGQVFLDEYQAATVRVGIGKILSSTERGLLFEFQGAGSLLPKTIGVKYEFLEFQSTRIFATEGFPGASGIGDLNDPSVGGFLANLV